MNLYNKDNPLRCFFAFEGYNSQGLALNKIKQYDPTFEWVCVGRSEIDKYAIAAANAIFPESADKNYGDISKIDWKQVPDFDLFTYSFPCQDISSAGKQRGLQEGSGTRSSLLWECQKAIEAKRPKFCLMENVAALVSEKFRPFFLEWERLMSRYDYTNYNKVLNAKDYGVPQNRERIFMVSILDPNKAFYWPEPMRLEKRLKDVLEQNVDEKYYLSDKLVNYVFSNGGVNKNIQGGVNVSKGEGHAGALTANYYKSPRQGNYIKEE
jgi:DNA (cytosine-5)-methyltransferase 1